MNTGRRRRCRPVVYPSADSSRRRGRRPAASLDAADFGGPAVCMQGPCCSSRLRHRPCTLADRLQLQLQLQQVASLWPLKVSVTSFAAIIYNFISAALIHHYFGSIYLLHHVCSTCLHYQTCSTCLWPLAAALDFLPSLQHLSTPQSLQY